MMASMKGLPNDPNTESSSAPSNATTNTCFTSKLCLLSHFGNCWIIDSGASDHICYYIYLFTEYTVLKCLANTITIPDGKKVKVTYTDTVRLNNHITLRNVLYVLGFQLNLIFVTKLCDDMLCSVSFISDSSVLQCPSLTRSIVKLKNGLYFVGEEKTTIEERLLLPYQVQLI